MTDRRKRAPKAYHQVHQLAFSPLFFQAAMAARDLGVLSAVHQAKDAGLTPVAVAERAGVSRYAARVLLEGCLALQLVDLREGCYRITTAGHLWLFDEMTKVNANFVQDICYAGAARLQDSLREGRPAGLEHLGGWSTIYAGLTELPADKQKSWFDFDHFYSDGAFPAAFPLVFRERPAKVLDVGGNTGKWALHCLRNDADVEITVLDHPGQLERLRENVRAAGHDRRLHTLALDLLDHHRAFPHGFDVVWMSQFLDCFAERDIAQLLARGKAALAPSGRLCILEAFWDRQPNDVAELCLQGTSLYFSCMANGEGRMYHSQDFLELLAEAGLRVVSDEAVGTYHTLLTCQA
ncbi:MAG: class I SAM-dependent methyltransferase [Kofleriaceae bacterium]